MKSLNVFQFVIDLFYALWDALRGRQTSGEPQAPAPAAFSQKPPRVMSARASGASHESSVTATIYIDPDAVDADDADLDDVELDPAESDLREPDSVESDDAVAQELPAVDTHADLARVEDGPADEQATGEQAIEHRSAEAAADEGEETADASASGATTAEEATAEEAAAEETTVETLPDEFFVELQGEQSALTPLLESLLFVSESALEPEQVAKVLPCSIEQIEAGLQRLRLSYQQEGRGLRIQERNGRYALVTMPTAAPLIEAFLNLDLDTRLSGPALEALAVIAYRQPATRSQIEAVRGVDCGHVLRVLLQHELIEETGRLETAGRPILYGVTDRFLQHFGLTSMNELPKLEANEADMLWAATQLAEEVAESEEGQEATAAT